MSIFVSSVGVIWIGLQLFEIHCYVTNSNKVAGNSEKWNGNSTGLNSYIEHEISSEQAKLNVGRVNLDELIGFGCKPCLEEETRYCQSKQVIRDHCCCNHKYEEIFPYMEHVCYVDSNQTEPCQTVLSDCAEFARLVECCCHRYLLQKWKSYYSSDGSRLLSENDTLLLLSVFMFIIKIAQF